MTTRLRQTFKYPSDDDDDDTRDGLDEQEQQDLVSALQSQDETANEFYITIFTLLPLFCTPVFVYYVLSSKFGGAVRMLCFLSITSLLASAFTMWFVPFSVASSALGRGYSTYHNYSAKRQIRVRKVPGLDLELDDDGPLGRAVPFLNMAICIILLLSSFGLKAKQNVPDGFWLLVLIPGVIYTMVTVARRSMREVERSIDGLSGLKYGYKGA